MSKTVKDTREGSRRRPHPKKYTDPIEDLEEYIESELQDLDNDSK